MEFLIAILATYGLTVLLTEMDGPAGIIARLRVYRFAEPLKCHTCTAFYVSLLVAIYPANTVLDWVVIVVALTGASTVLERISNG